MRKKGITIFAVLLICFAFIWIGAIVRCEILTLQYGNEFVELYKQTHMIADVDYLKIIHYNSNKAEVYFVTKHKCGNILKFIKNNNLWAMEDWETIWSQSGSADGFVWPYIR